MSKLEELIQKYCPDGVELRTIGEVCQKVFAGGTPTSSNSSYYGGDIPWLRSGEVNFNEITSTEKTITEEGYNSSSARWVESQSVLVAMTGATVARSAITMIELTANQSVCALVPKREILNYRFLYYWISKSYLQMKGMAQGALTSLNLNLIKSIEIPVPPLPVQEEIVRVLDTFTELQAELQAELQKRLQQYNYYRDNLLSFEGRTDVEWKKLGEIATIKTGRRFVRTDIRESGVPCFHYGDIYTYYGLTATQTKGYLDEELAKKLRFAQPNDVVVVCAGENDMDIGVGVAWLGDEPAVVHDACCILHHNQNPRYISHFLRTHNYHLQMKKYVKNGKISSLPASGLAEALIPIPSLDEQERIASILDRFDALTRDLTAGLPAEIEKRRQQYEYYRDKLLTFKRVYNQQGLNLIDNHQHYGY